MEPLCCKKVSPRAGEIAQLVKCLLHNCQEVILDLQHLHKKIGVVACIHNTRAGEAETGRTPVFLD